MKKTDIAGGGENGEIEAVKKKVFEAGETKMERKGCLLTNLALPQENQHLDARLTKRTAEEWGPG